MTAARDEIVRTALHAIKQGMSIEQVITNAVDSAIEFQGVRQALHESVDLKRLKTPEDIDEIASLTANRRLPAAPAKPSGEHPDSPWWGKGEK